MEHLEIEFKTFIDYEIFTSLKKKFFNVEPIIQKNEYFDTKDHYFFKKNIMIRLRKIDNNKYFTMKLPQNIGVLEKEFKVQSIFDERIQIILNEYNFNCSDLILFTWSVTERYNIHDEYGTWSLDYSKFPNSLYDYEVEYELFNDTTIKQSKEHFNHFLSQWDIQVVESSPKYIRALKAKNLI